MFAAQHSTAPRTAQQEAGRINRFDEIGFERQGGAFDLGNEQFCRQRRPHQTARTEAKQAIQTRLARNVFKMRIRMIGRQGADQGQPVLRHRTKADAAFQVLGINAGAGAGQAELKPGKVVEMVAESH